MHYNFCMSSHIFVKRKRLASIGARKLNVSLLLALDGFKIDS
ncbi:hypothetical protein LEP1GSC148_0624 [Leptospira interrogans serovar Canicola str. LT1962]|nr:hypothetical protein LEP1GSC148_0624 [Leptospira interrogans serovar Canicola str. LT1962]